MPAERFYYPQEFSVGSTILIKEAEFHHLAHVMKNSVGDTIEIVNGQGLLGTGNIVLIKRDHAEIHIVSLTRVPPSSPSLILVQAFCQQSKLDFVIEKGTELGVDRFYFFPGERSAKKDWFPSQTERAQAITVAAMKQSGRLFLPTLHILPRLQEWKEPIFPTASTFFGDLVGSPPSFFEFWKTEKTHLPAIFLTGPESGLSQQETAKLKDWGATGIRLHPNILRTETASIAAISLLSHYIQYVLQES